MTEQQRTKKVKTLYDHTIQLTLNDDLELEMAVIDPTLNETQSFLVYLDWEKFEAAARHLMVTRQRIIDSGEDQ